MHERLNLKNIGKLAFIFAMAIFSQILANKVADYSRGYEAIGGEIFVFPMVLLLGYFLLFTISYSYKSYKDYKEEEEFNEFD